MYQEKSGNPGADQRQQTGERDDECGQNIDLLVRVKSEMWPETKLPEIIAKQLHDNILMKYHTWTRPHSSRDQAQQRVL
jgi:hypothetical protein